MEGPIDNLYALIGFITFQLFGIIGVYMKVRSDRRTTSEKRDQDTADLKEDMVMVKSRVATMESEQDRSRDTIEKLFSLLSDIRVDVAFLRGSADKKGN